jgi:phage shock protein A/DNA-binding HxlR family transcriptional regulator
MKLTLAGAGNILGYFGKYRGHSWWSVGYDLGGEGTIGKLLALPDYQVAQVLAVLGSEVRLAMLRSLLQSPKNAAELVAELQLGTTAQADEYLREMERVGYLEQREGRYHFVERFIRVYLTALALASHAGNAVPDTAEERMRRELAEAKERAVAAIALRNQLRYLLQQQQDKAAQLEAGARKALKQGRDDFAGQLLIEKGNMDWMITSLVAALEQAEQAAAAAKESVRALEAHFRLRQVEQAAGGLDLQIAMPEQGVSEEQVEEQLQKLKAELRVEAAREDERSRARRRRMSRPR